jgi:formate hydrogenlyase subunit 3/multisubunit Na+/H+ antiporter MnhD subunit
MSISSGRCGADGVFPDYSIFAMLAVAVLGALLSLALPRPRDVLRLIVAISSIELALAANLWASVLANGFVTAADGWFYVDAFSAFYLVVLVLVFLLSSAFAGVYFAHETGEHGFTLPVARRVGALWLG